MATVETQFTGDAERYLRALTASVNKTAELESKLRGVGREGKRAAADTSEGFGERAVTKLLAYGAGLLSIQTGIQAASRMWQTYIENAREAGAQTEDAIKKAIAFLAIQEGGKKKEAFERASNLATRFGITDRAEAFNIVQSLQSALGNDLEKGLAAAEQVFAATLAGMQLSTARELAFIGTSQGMTVQESLNKAFVTGQLSKREPETIAAAAPGLPFFADKNLGFAATGVLAGGVKANELETFVKAAGRALEPEPGSDTAKFLAKITGGLSEKDATQLSQLETLKVIRAELGERVTLDDIQGAGIKETREAQSMMILLNNFPELMRFLKEIPKQAADPMLILRKRAEIEGEVPEARRAREIDILRAKQKDAQALGPSGQAGADLEREQMIRGLAMRRIGAESALGMDLIDAQGRSTKFDEMLLGLPRMDSATPARLRTEMDTIRGELGGVSPSAGLSAANTPIGDVRAKQMEMLHGMNETASAMLQQATAAISEAANSLKTAARQMFGGATRVPRSTDR